MYVLRFKGIMLIKAIQIRKKSKKDMRFGWGSNSGPLAPKATH